MGKAEEYREHAREARARAAVTRGQTAEFYLWVAREWELLAEEHGKIAALLRSLDVPCTDDHAGAAR